MDEDDEMVLSADDVEDISDTSAEAGAAAPRRPNWS
jgi:hypothetical protein